jgi:hypothetical protein
MATGRGPRRLEPSSGPPTTLFARLVVVFGRLPERLSAWTVAAEGTYQPEVEGRTQVLRRTVLTRESPLAPSGVTGGG